jgi:hypothetical protein
MIAELTLSEIKKLLLTAESLPIGLGKVFVHWKAHLLKGNTS